MQSTARQDKNKGAREPLATILESLDRDLAELLVSLATYQQSDHTQRYEALRRHLSILESYHRQLDRELARGVPMVDEEAQPSRAAHSRID